MARANIFWRASIGYHEGCANATQPYAAPISFNDPRVSTLRFNVKYMFAQERLIVWPAMRKLGATILRADALTMLRPDGHRGMDGHFVLYERSKGASLVSGQVDCLHYCEPGSQMYGCNCSTLP